MDTLRSKMTSWEDPDVTAYELAVTLGILSPDVPFATDAKHVFWISNRLGDALDDILNVLVRIGALEYDAESQQYRWNEQFAWREVSSRRGR